MADENTHTKLELAILSKHLNLSCLTKEENPISYDKTLIELKSLIGEYWVTTGLAFEHRTIIKTSDGERLKNLVDYISTKDKTYLLIFEYPYF